jgi:predicted DNA-binding protein
MKTITSVNMPDELLERIKEDADNEERSVSSQIVKILRLYYEDR